MARNDSVTLTLFLASLVLSAAAMVAAWIFGRQWGDLASRRHYGEALGEDEQKTLRRCRRNFWSWAGISLLLAAFAFFLLR